jgi:hypothetical protein
VPVDGFSVQGHLSTRYGFPATLQQNLQRFDDLGLETAITEVDVRMDVPAGQQPTWEQLERQATDYRRALEACLGVEDCTSFTIWGFTDRYSWVPVSSRARASRTSSPRTTAASPPTTRCSTRRTTRVWASRARRRPPPRRRSSLHHVRPSVRIHSTPVLWMRTEVGSERSG